MGTYRQTNTLKPTEEQFVELFDLHKKTFWDYAAYTWYNPKHLYTDFEQFRDEVMGWSLGSAIFYQMWWEDDTLLGFRAFHDANQREDFNGAMVHTASDDGPIPKIIGDNPDWKNETLKTDLMVTRPDSTGDAKHWMRTRPEISPVWDNNDGESLYQAMWQYGKKRAYCCTHGRLQKQLLWGSRDCESLKHDIWLQMGYSFNERKELGFNPDEQESFIYRLVGGKQEHMGWPSIHSLYHVNNVERPDSIERPYIASVDEPEKLGIQPAPIPSEPVQ